MVVVYRLDRLARSTRDLLGIAEQLRDTGAGLRSLGEPWADTTSPAGRMVLTVFAGIAEFERALIQERTGAGRAAAMQRGVRFGRPAKLAADQVALAQRLLEEGTAAGEVARMFKVHRATLYRALGAIPSKSVWTPEAGLSRSSPKNGCRKACLPVDGRSSREHRPSATGDDLRSERADGGEAFGGGGTLDSIRRTMKALEQHRLHELHRERERAARIDKGVHVFISYAHVDKSIATQIRENYPGGRHQLRH